VAHRRWIAWSAVAAAGVVARSFATSDRAVSALSPPRVIRRASSALVFALARCRPWATVGARTNQVELTLGFCRAQAFTTPRSSPELRSSRRTACGTHPSTRRSRPTREQADPAGLPASVRGMGAGRRFSGSIAASGDDVA